MNNLLPLLRRSISTDSPTVLSTHVELLHQHFHSFYHALDSAATSDPSLLLSQDWRNSLEKPLLWLGDLHPYLFTNLAHSFLQEEPPSDDINFPQFDNLRDSLDLYNRPLQVSMAWRNPSETLRQESIGTVIGYLESGLGIRWCRCGVGACRRGGEAAARVAPRNHQNRTARGVRSQPRVDAEHVKPVPALRHHSNFVAGGELWEADHAVGEFPCGFGGGSELGEGAEDLLLDAKKL